MISRIRISASFRLVNEGYFVPAASEIAKAVSCPVIVVGGFRSLTVMEEVLNGTDIELISLSRPLLCEPDLPGKMTANVAACPHIAPIQKPGSPKILPSSQEQTTRKKLSMNAIRFVNHGTLIP